MGRSPTSRTTSPSPTQPLVRSFGIGIRLNASAVLETPRRFHRGRVHESARWLPQDRPDPEKDEDIMRILVRVLAVLAVFSIMRGSAAAQSSYYRIGGYCNGSDPCRFGDPIDLATGAFHIDERLATIPGRVPIVL